VFAQLPLVLSSKQFVLRFRTFANYAIYDSLASPCFFLLSLKIRKMQWQWIDVVVLCAPIYAWDQCHWEVCKHQDVET
jgi:hypothetical protein